MDRALSAEDRVAAELAASGVRTQIRRFDASTRTAAEAAKAIGTQVGQIVKSLVFLAGDLPVLALVSGSNQLDTDKLSRLVGEPISRADAVTVRRATSFAIGGVPPLGFPGRIPTYIDRDLFQYDVVWAAAGTPHHVFKITPAELARISGGTPADLKRATEQT
jgi:prolyl-tRNA editing enzyme YbaK/EbsC (Cys-tRNA(Pro) deacylase)